MSQLRQKTTAGVEQIAALQEEEEQNNIRGNKRCPSSRPLTDRAFRNARAVHIRAQHPRFQLEQLTIGQHRVADRGDVIEGLRARCFGKQEHGTQASSRSEHAPHGSRQASGGKRSAGNREDSPELIPSSEAVGCNRGPSPHRRIPKVLATRLRRPRRR